MTPEELGFRRKSRGIAVARAESDAYLKIERAAGHPPWPGRAGLSRHAERVSQMLGEWDEPAAREEWEKIRSIYLAKTARESSTKKAKAPKKSSRGSQEYRGWRIEYVPGMTQVGYRIGEGMRSQPGKGRKVNQWYVHYPEGEGAGSKAVSSLAHAKRYIDEYLGG